MAEIKEQINVTNEVANSGDYLTLSLVRLFAFLARTK
jgi:hypothetical protein